MNPADILAALSVVNGLVINGQKLAITLNGVELNDEQLAAIRKDIGPALCIPKDGSEKVDRAATDEWRRAVVAGEVPVSNSKLRRRKPETVGA